MRLDQQDQVMTGQVITTGTVVSADSRELTRIGIDPSIGEPIGALLQVRAVSGTGATYTFNVVQSAATALTSPTVLASATRTTAQLRAGLELLIPIPPGVINQKHLGIQVVVSGGTAPSVTLDAYVPVRVADQPVNPLFEKINFAEM